LGSVEAAGGSAEEAEKVGEAGTTLEGAEGKGEKLGVASGVAGPARLQDERSKQMQAAANVDRRKDLG
jgi:hypothetical protein